MLLAIHAQQIERYGGTHGILDANVIRSALALPIRRWAYIEEVDPADCAAGYLVSFARSQGFSDGNRRTGLASALVFLALNGFALHVALPELYAFTMRVAKNDAEDRIVGAYFRERMEPQ